MKRFDKGDPVKFHTDCTSAKTMEIIKVRNRYNDQFVDLDVSKRNWQHPKIRSKRMTILRRVWVGQLRGLTQQERLVG